MYKTLRLTRGQVMTKEDLHNSLTEGKQVIANLLPCY